MWMYDQSVRPPAPFVEVRLRHPEDRTLEVSVRAKIDTAADISAIPASLVSQLHLPPTKKLTVRGYDNTLSTVFTYSVFLNLSSTQFEGLRIIVSPKPYAILGRDVLNHFYIRLNGPELTFEMSPTPFT